MPYKNKLEQINYSRIYYLKNKKRILDLQKERYIKNPELFNTRCRNSYYKNQMFYIQKGKEYIENNPWVKHLKSARQRCNNPKDKSFKYYGKSGIKCCLTIYQIKKLWFRDKAYNLKYPSLDRKNSKKNYTLENCRFIEFVDNCIHKPKLIYQYDLDGNFIKSWFNSREIKRTLSYDDSYIRKVIRDNTQFAYGNYWID